MRSSNSGMQHARLVTGEVFKYALVIGLVLVLISPILWIVISSLKPAPELLRARPTFIPENPTLANYVELLQVSRFPRYFLNSVIVSGLGAFVAVVLSTLGAYSVYRCRYRGRRLFFSLIIAIYIFPRILLLLTLYPLFQAVGIIDTSLSLIIAYVGLTAPLNVWIIRAFFVSVPIDLEDAAFVDGANRLQVLIRIFVPLSATGIAAIAISSFMMCWTEYLFASVLLISDVNKTLPIGMSQFLQQYNVDWELLTASAVLMTLPPILGFALAGRYFIRGMTAGAIK